MTTPENTAAPIAIYLSADGSIATEVRLEGETVWLSQEQISQLFGRERSVITKHLRNAFNEGELAEESNVQNLHIANSDKPVKFYNLDVIISVGYRVKSLEGHSLSPMGEPCSERLSGAGLRTEYATPCRRSRKISNSLNAL